MGIVEKFTAFSEEDIQNVCNNIFMIIIIILLWFYVVTDIPCPSSCLFNIVIFPGGLSHIFFPWVFVFFFWLRQDLSIVVG